MTENHMVSQALAIIDNCPLPLLLVDNQDQATAFNPAFEKLLGGTAASELLGHSLATLGDHPARSWLGLEKTIAWTDRTGTQRHFEIHSFRLPQTDHGEARIFVDISKQVELERARQVLNEEVKQQILTDPVTGLLSRRGLMLALEPQVARSRRYNNPISVIMMDIHTGPEREKTLVHIARLLKDQLRWADLIGCNEQHEFILVLPETAPDAALTLADKLKQRLQTLSQEKFGTRPLWACYGVTGWRKSDSAETLLQRASLALSKARSEQSNHSIAL